MCFISVHYSILSTVGYPAFDCSIQQEVLIMSVVLVFLADSPMHAEITSTPMPSNSNNPCRACQLSVTSRNDKNSTAYVKNFLRIPGEVGGSTELKKTYCDI